MPHFAVLCSGRPLHMSIALFIWCICQSADALYTDQPLERLAIFPTRVWAVLVPAFTLESFLQSCCHSVSMELLTFWGTFVGLRWDTGTCSAGAWWSVCIWHIVCSCLAMCPLITLPWMGASRKRTRHIAQYEMAERFYWCVRKDFILPF